MSDARPCSTAELGAGVFVPLLDVPKLALPIDTVKVSAGFPSPAADYEGKRLDINDYLVRNPVSTFFFSVEGDSMEGAEVFDGDILVVDTQCETTPWTHCCGLHRWTASREAPVPAGRSCRAGRRESLLSHP